MRNSAVFLYMARNECHLVVLHSYKLFLNDAIFYLDSSQLKSVTPHSMDIEIQLNVVLHSKL